MRNSLVAFFTCALFLQAQGVQAQDDSAYVQLSPRSLIVKFSHFSLVDPLSSLQFALEHQLGGKTSLQHEAGYITRILYNEEMHFKEPKGLRLRNELRFYMGESGSRLAGFYLAPELLFIHLNYKRSATAGRECDSRFDCAYYQRVNYEVQKQVYGIHQKVGFQAVARRFVFDMYAGIGYRHVRVNYLNKPPNSWDESPFFSLRKTEGTYDLPSMSFGFKFGYLLYKRKERVLIKKYNN